MTLIQDAKLNPLVIPLHHENVNVHLVSGIVHQGIGIVPRGIGTVHHGIGIVHHGIGIVAAVAVKEVGHVSEGHEVVNDVVEKKEVVQETQNDDHHQDQIKVSNFYFR